MEMSSNVFSKDFPFLGHVWSPCFHSIRLCFLLSIFISASILNGQSTSSKELGFLLEKMNRFYETRAQDSMEVYAPRLIDATAGESLTLARYWALYYHALANLMKECPECMDYAQQSFEGFQQLDELEGSLRAVFLVGNYYLKQSSFAPAAEWFQKAVDILLAIPQAKRTEKQMERLARSYSRLAQCHTYLLEPERALEAAVNAYKLAQDLENPLTQITVLVAVGNTVSHAKKESEARSYFHEALLIAKAAKDTTNQALCLGNLGKSFLEEEKTDSAAVYLKKALALNLEIENWISATFNYQNLGVLYLLAKKPKQAIPYLQEAFSLSRQHHLIDQEASALNNLGEVAYQQKDWQKAIELTLQAIELKKQMGNRRGLLNSYDLIQDAYSELGNYKLAMFYYEEKSALEDSLDTGKTQARIAELTNEIQAVKTEKEQALQEEQQRLNQMRNQQKILFLVTGLILLALLTLVLFLYNRQRIAKAREAAWEMEQRLLHSQMNPHFTFNALSSIQSYLLDQGEPDQGAYYLTKFAKLIRKNLEHSRETLIPLQAELEALQHYLSIQQLRYEQQFDFYIELDAKIDREAVFLPPLLIQPFVENAIEHGRIYSKPDGWVKVLFQRAGDDMQVLIRDNGIGRSTARSKQNKESKHGLSSAITKERCTLLSKKYKRPFTYRLRDYPEGGTEVILVVPMLGRQ